MQSRREFVQLGITSAATLALRLFGALPALAQNNAEYRALVCVFLFGGNDSNNMIVPFDDANYQAYRSLRGDLALVGADLAPAVQAMDGQPFAFHSQLGPLSNLFASKELAVVANVGPLVQPLTRSEYRQQLKPIPVKLFSHPDQQKQWQTSAAEDSSPSGWGGRAADYVSSQNMNSSQFPTSVSVAGNSLFVSGADTQPLALSSGLLDLYGYTNSQTSQTRLNAFTNLLSLSSGISLVQAANRVGLGIPAAAALNDALANAAGLRTTFPASALGSQLRQVAQVIQVRSQLGMRRQIFFCGMSGFDTHSDEKNLIRGLYQSLGQALSAFYTATQELGVSQQVTTFTESDFNRTFRPNTSGGTDHAWGGHHLVLGGAVRGGRVYGRFPTFQIEGPDDAGAGGHWIPTTAIEQYGATLCSWFGVPDQILPAVFPNLGNFNAWNLGFMQ